MAKEELYKLALDSYHEYPLLAELMAIRDERFKDEQQDSMLCVNGYVGLDTLNNYVKLQQENQQLKIQISTREEEYKKLKEALNTKHFCKYANKCNEWVDCYREEYADMVQANVRLVNNWNELKIWLKKELGDRINPNKDKWLTGVYDAYRETIDKMQELEQGE